MDRENVIKAVDICLGHGKCNDCPYCLSGAGYTTMNCRDYMMRDVLALLKEQETELCDRCGRKRLKSSRINDA